jgi:hypothetical protein
MDRFAVTSRLASPTAADGYDATSDIGEVRAVNASSSGSGSDAITWR